LDANAVQEGESVVDLVGLDESLDDYCWDGLSF